MYIPGRMGVQQAVACDQFHERFSLLAAKRSLNQKKPIKIYNFIICFIYYAELPFGDLSFFTFTFLQCRMLVWYIIYIIIITTG